MSGMRRIQNHLVGDEASQYYNPFLDLDPNQSFDWYADIHPQQVSACL